LQELLDEYRHWYNTSRHHTATRTTPRQAWDNAPCHGGPGHLPRQDDATVHKLTVGSTGNIDLGQLTIHIRNDQAGQVITVIRDHDRVTAYNADGDPIGHLNLDHTRRYQGTLTPAA
jgi:putative transposase